MSKSSQRIKQLIETAISSLSVLFFTLLSGILIARYLGVDARGEYGELLVSIGIGVAIGSLSMSDALLTALRELRLHATWRLIAKILFCCVSLTLICTLLVLNMSGLSENTINSIIFLATLVIFCFVEIFNKILYTNELANGKYRLLNIERTLVPAVFVLLLLFVYFYKNKSVELIFFIFVVSKLPLFLIRLLRFQLTNEIGNKNSGEFFYLWAKSIRLHVPASISILAVHLDKLFIAILFDSTELGFYFVCVAAVGAFYSMASQAIGLFGLAEFSGGERRESLLKFERYFRLLTCLSIIFGMLSLLSLPILIPVLYGEEYVGSVGFIVPIVCTCFISILRAIFVELLRSSSLWKVQVMCEVMTIVVVIIAGLVSTTIHGFLNLYAVMYGVVFVINITLFYRYNLSRSPLHLLPSFVEFKEFIIKMFRVVFC